MGNDMETVIYTNEMPPPGANIIIRPAISSCSPECIANANKLGVMPTPDLCYFEVMWKKRQTTYVHRFYYPTYREAVEGEAKLTKELLLSSNDWIDPLLAARCASTERAMQRVRFNRAKAKYWDDCLAE